MAVVIIDRPEDVQLTSVQYEKMLKEYRKTFPYSETWVPFEEFVKQKLNQDD